MTKTKVFFGCRGVVFFFASFSSQAFSNDAANIVITVRDTHQDPVSEPLPNKGH